MMLDSLLKSKFYSKCKSDIKLTKKRIEIIMRKRNAVHKFLRNDVADLLKNDFDSHAYSRVEGLYIEQNLSSCYKFVEQSCLHIISHLSAMDKQRECPGECREAIASLMFAAARFADLPELRDLRSLFSGRYGNYLEPFVNQEFVKKLKADPPTKEMKLQLMKEIAIESGLNWDSRALDQKLYNPPSYVQDWSQSVNKDKSVESPKNPSFYGHESRIRETESKDFDCLKKVDCSYGNALPFKSRVAVEKKPDENRHHGRVSPYWSSTGSSSSETTTSPEYSTGPDDSASEDAVIERKFYGFRSMAPPYVKTDSTKRETSSESISKHKEVPANSNKPVPRSMRRRPLKPVQDSPENNEVSKFPNDGIRDYDPIDEEEKKMNKLLLHYSRKPVLPCDSVATRATTRTGSLPVEPSASPVEPEVRKGYARAVSCESGSSLGSPLAHVHPKLPDYDEFVARLAAFRASS